MMKPKTPETLLGSGVFEEFARFYRAEFFRVRL